MATLMIIWLQKNNKLQDKNLVMTAILGGFAMDGVLMYQLVQLASS